MIKSMKLVLPIVMLTFGLRAASEKDFAQATKVNIHPLVRVYLEAKASLLKSGYLYNKLRICLSGIPSIIVDTPADMAKIGNGGNSVIGQILTKFEFTTSTKGVDFAMTGHLAANVQAIGNAFPSLGKLIAVPSRVLSPDKKYLASTCEDHTVRLWQFDYPTSFSTTRGTYNYCSSKILIGHDKGTGAICFRDDSKAMVTGADDHKVIYWDLEKNNIIFCLGHEAPIAIVRFINENTFISLSKDCVLKIWMIREGSSLLLSTRIINSPLEFDFLVNELNNEDKSMAKTALNKLLSSIPASSLTTNNVRDFKADVAAAVAFLEDYEPGKKANEAQLSNSKTTTSKSGKSTAASTGSSISNINRSMLIDGIVQVQEERKQKETITNILQRTKNSKAVDALLQEIRKETNALKERTPLEDRLALFATSPDKNCANFYERLQEIRDLDNEISRLEEGDRKNLLLARISIIKRIWGLENVVFPTNI